MILKIFSVRDRATDQFGTPMFMMTVGQAIRSFSDEINQADKTQSQLRSHPEDFDLYELGEFDVGSGIFSTSNPKQVAIGKDLVFRG